MKKMIEKLEKGFTLSDGKKDYKAMIEEYLFEGYELNVEEYVYNNSADLYDYCCKYASKYLNGEFEDLALNFPTMESALNNDEEEAIKRVLKRTWEEIKDLADEE